jgi:predicted ATPase
MITRLQVSGFKNLVDTDVRFGPFTCIAGANGVGKSNLFDAIRFLSALADLPLMEAAKSVRGGKTADIRSLFHRVGSQHDDRMKFAVEMIVPKRGEDDLGQEATASTTFLRYSLELGLRMEDSHFPAGGLEILQEELVHITQGEAHKHLLFPHSLEWRRDVVSGRRSAPFVSTSREEHGKTLIKLHLDRGSEASSSGGKPAPRLASTLPRTVLSVANAAENRTAVLARRELQSWRLLQLEPSALREPDDFTSPTKLGADGSHLAATLYHLARTIDPAEGDEPDEERLYARVANRLRELIEDVRGVSIDRDERRELLTLTVAGKDGTVHPARALSDGTLRFLALAAIDLDPSGQGVLCLEEPENGIHPARIPAMLSLLQDIAVDTMLPVGPDNPLRQVIINTHSPSVVGQVTDDTLVVAETREEIRNGEIFQKVSFGCLPATWRADSGSGNVVSKGRLMVYLNPNAPIPGGVTGGDTPKQKTRRVVDRADLQQLRLFPIKGVR